MPQQQGAIIVKKPKPEIMALSALMALGGVGMVLWFLKSKAVSGYGPLKKITATELMSMPIAAGLESDMAIALKIGQILEIPNPTVMYEGPGRDTFSYLRAVQLQGTQEVTVMGSGIAGVHVGPASEPTVFNLVAEDQPQPVGPARAALLAYNWPGPPGATPSDPSPCPISGAPPQVGYADVLLEIYQKQADSGDPRDADGFASPTYNGRVPVMYKLYRNKILFSM